MPVDQVILDMIEGFEDIRFNNARPSLMLLRKCSWLIVSTPVNVIDVDLQVTGQCCDIGRLDDHTHAEVL